MLTTTRIEVWVWVLVYGGMILLGLGMSVLRGGARFGWGIALTGVALVAVGAVLVWLRSTLPQPRPDPSLEPKPDAPRGRRANDNEELP